MSRELATPEDDVIDTTPREIVDLDAGSPVPYVIGGIVCTLFAFVAIGADPWPVKLLAGVLAVAPIVVRATAFLADQFTAQPAVPTQRKEGDQ